MSANLLKAYEKLQRRASITSSSRFNAASRVENRALMSIWAVSLMSVYLLALSLIPFIITKVGERYGTEINAISACLSLLMLVVSVIESMRDHGRVAHLYHDAGLRIRKLQNDVSIAMAEGNFTTAELKKLHSEYDQILSDVGPNHREVDVLKFEISKGIARDSSAERPLNWHEHITKRVSYYCRVLAHCILYVVCMVTPFVAIVIMFVSSYGVKLF